MSETLKLSHHERIEDKKLPSPEELAKKKQELFEFLKSKKLTQNEKYVATQIFFEHSITDGLEFAKILDLKPSTVIDLFDGLSFVRNHPTFSQNLAVVIDRNRDYFPRDPVAKMKLESVPDRIRYNLEEDRGDKVKELMGQHFIFGNTLEIERRILDFYSNLLPLRQVAVQGAFKEREESKDKYKRRPKSGIELGEEALLSTEKALIPHYYTSQIRNYLRKIYSSGKDSTTTLPDEELEDLLSKQLNETDILALFHQNLIAEEMLDRILNRLNKKSLFGKEERGRALEKARYKPLDLVHNMKREESERLLKKEIVDSLGAKGYDKEGISFEWDEEEKRFKVIYKQLEDTKEIKKNEENINDEPVIDEKKLHKKLRPFIKKIIEESDHVKISDSKITLHYFTPKEINYQNLSTDRISDKLGEVTLNPEVQNVDFEKAKVFIPDLTKFINQPFYVVAEYLAATYGDKYHIPGFEYLEWLSQKNNPPTFTEDKKIYTLFGSVCGGETSYGFKCFIKKENRISFGTVGTLTWHWGGNDRAVLLEKEQLSKLSSPEKFEFDVNKMEKREYPEIKGEIKQVEIVGEDIYMLDEKGFIYRNGQGITKYPSDTEIFKIGKDIYVIYENYEKVFSHSLFSASYITDDAILEVVDMNGKIGKIVENNGVKQVRIDGEVITQDSSGEFSELKVINGQITYIYEAGGEKYLNYGAKIYGPYRDIKNPIGHRNRITFVAEEVSGHQVIIDGFGNELYYKEEIKSIHSIGGELYVHVREVGIEYFIKGIDQELAKDMGFESILDIQQVNGKIVFRGLTPVGQNILFKEGEGNSSEELLGLETDAQELLYFRDEPFWVSSSGSQEFQIRNLSGNRWKFDSPITIKQTEDLMFFGGMKDGRFISYTYDVPNQQTQETEIIEGEIDEYLNGPDTTKLTLLNALKAKDPEMIREYFEVAPYLLKESGITNKSFKEKAKDFVESSKNVTATINKTIRSSPELFVNTMAATRDEFAPWYAEQVLYELFPEIPENKRRQQEEKERKQRGKFGGMFGKVGKPDIFKRAPSPETYLIEKHTQAVYDGDPKEKDSPEVIRTREVIEDMIVTGIYGKYNKATKEWSQIEFPISPDLDEQVKEYTFELPNIKNLEVVNLPQIVGAQIIQDRVKGISASGKEIKLHTTINKFGQVTASLLGIKEEVVKIIYSQSKQEIPVVPGEISSARFRAFKEALTNKYGKELLEPITSSSTQFDLFLALIKEKSPKEQVEEIEAYVRRISYYDMDNREMQEAKASVSGVEERFSLMERRMKRLKERKPELEKELSGKKYAGVCADFAILTTALLRRAGIPSGYLSGFKPNSKSVTVMNAHGTSYVVWPKETGYQIIPVDGTPQGVTAEDKKLLEGISKPSLKEKEQIGLEKKDEYIAKAEERFKEVQEILKNNDMEQIKNLTNGELESLLNVVLKYEVKKSHLNILEVMINAARYGGKEIPQKGEAKKEVEFRQFVENEIERSRKLDSNENQYIPAGERLMTMITQFSDAYERETRSRDQAFQKLERMVELSASKLNEIEKKSAMVVITYLRAKKMLK